jgi:hypothetical protein
MFRFWGKTTVYSNNQQNINYARFFDIVRILRLIENWFFSNRIRSI